MCCLKGAVINRHIVFFCLIFLLLGCGGGNRNRINAGGIYPEEEIETIVWETKGGGDLYFSIERLDNQFEISIERRAFRPVDIVLVLKDQDLPVYHLVEEIFENRISLLDCPIAPIGTTGTWHL